MKIKSHLKIYVFYSNGFLHFLEKNVNNFKSKQNNLKKTIYINFTFKNSNKLKYTVD